MASFTFNASTEHFSRLIDAICGLQDYEDESQETEETRQQFTKRKILEWLVAQVRRWEQAEAQRIAAATVADIDLI